MHGKRVKHRMAAMARRVGWHPSALRRRSDRIESAVVLGAILLALASVPLGMATYSVVYRHNLAVSATQTAAVHQADATLLDGLPSMPSMSGYNVNLPVQARWRLPNGQSRVGVIRAPEGTAAGSIIPIWTDARGEQIDAPLSTSQAWARGVLAFTLTIVGAIGLLCLACAIVRRYLDRGRFADWEAEWREIGPRWTHRAR